jgi:hypothetical protein
MKLKQEQRAVEKDEGTRISVEVIERRIERANAQGVGEVAQTLTRFLEKTSDPDTLRRMADLILVTTGVSQ